MAELQRAEQQSATVASRPGDSVKQGSAESETDDDLGSAENEQGASFLESRAVEGGEKPSVALPLLWEADHHQHVATTWAGSTGQVTRFTKSLSDAVATDTVLSAWLTSKQKVVQLVAGVPAKPHLRWAVQVAPAAGEDVFFREFFGRRTCSVWLAGIKRRKQLRRDWFLQTFEAPPPPAQRERQQPESLPPPLRVQEGSCGTLECHPSCGRSSSIAVQWPDPTIFFGPGWRRGTSGVRSDYLARRFN